MIPDGWSQGRLVSYPIGNFNQLNLTTMKVQTKITDITHDDLVDLLSTSTYGSNYLDLAYVRRYEYEKYKQEDDCREDVYARMLLNGCKIEVRDYYAEDEDDCYGHLQRQYNEEDECMVYQVSLQDIADGIAKAIDNGGWSRECAMHLIDNNGDLDLYEAENLMQIITFGETIYG